MNLIEGLAVGVEKPNFNIFLTPIVEELQQLQYGININQQNIKFFVIAGIFDKPARASILNIIQYNGFYGCVKCTQPGISYETSKGKAIAHI